MKKIVILFSLLLIVCLLSGFSSPQPKPEVKFPIASAASSNPSQSSKYPYLVDNFEDGDLVKSPEWFTFDSVVAKVVRNTGLTEGDAGAVANAGTYSLSISGSTNKWYVGGIGLMIGVDATKYKSVEMDVYSYGDGSGKIKVELYDKDSLGSEIEVDKSWKPKNDDLWIYEVDVTWKGWKHLSVPFTSLKLDNPGRGNGMFDPSLDAGSGGLVKMQLIFVANEEVGKINFNLNNIELGN